ncbi:hypothetical protein SAMN05878295_1033 [Aeromonas hydrophila]|nr:hypothetical protein SAMN05878295_1033 [Aeromonas hydrophila]SIQ61512.1 hypothetical protein SAMN05880569_1033 [Aeromonas hydrophila]
MNIKIYFVALGGHQCRDLLWEIPLLTGLKHKPVQMFLSLKFPLSKSI